MTTIVMCSIMICLKKSRISASFVRGDEQSLVEHFQASDCRGGRRVESLVPNELSVCTQGIRTSLVSATT
jgi:hypothetical protein